MDVTSTVDAVNLGFGTSGNTILSFINGNIGTILTVFGIVLGVGLLMKLFKRGAR